MAKMKTMMNFNLAPSVISLQCYVCNSNQDKNCADGNDFTNFIQTCSETMEPYCRKIDQIGRRNKRITQFSFLHF